jgi:acyl carrier protein
VTTTSEFVDAMVAWLNDRIAPVDFTITSDTPLFEGGLIDSIRVLELIAWTEEAIGAVIPDVRIRMDNFRTVARIAEVFVQEQNDAAA